MSENVRVFRVVCGKNSFLFSVHSVHSVVKRVSLVLVAAMLLYELGGKKHLYIFSAPLYNCYLPFGFGHAAMG